MRQIEKKRTMEAQLRLQTSPQRLLTLPALVPIVPLGRRGTAQHSAMPRSAQRMRV
jgi:hypothetical protein